MNQLDVVHIRPWTEPRELFHEFAGRQHCVWLDAVGGAAGYSILAAEPDLIFRSKGNHVEIATDAGVISRTGDPFVLLADVLTVRRTKRRADFPLGAAIGYFGYDLKNFIEKLPANALDDIGLPDCWFGFYDHLLVFDHTTRRLHEVGRALYPPRRGRAHAASDIGGGTVSTGFPVAALSERRFRRSQTAATAKGYQRPDLHSNFTRETYGAAILRAKEYIAAGEIYQVNLSQRFQCETNATAAELYLTLRETNPAPYSAYLDIGDAQILSSSPECFLRIHDRGVVTRPIKGTRPRGKTPEEDQRVAAELLASPKDNAELVMITDLERNDLGRVCDFGSVRVSDLVRVETYATVHHLVSTVEGRLRPDVSHVDCVRACFPGGSITGAPKIRAMRIIDELEPHARGVYTGAIGFLGYNGLTHLNIAIRTIVNQSGRLTFHAGGGIVADSEPDNEYEETLAKTQGLRHAIDQLRLR